MANIEEILRSHKAKWHDSCRLQFNTNELLSERHPQQKMKMLPRTSTLVEVYPKLLLTWSSAFSVENLQKLQSHCIMLQHLVLMHVSDNVPYSCKTKVC